MYESTRRPVNSLLKYFIYFFKVITYVTDQYLTHYWPICDGQMLDQIGMANMIQGNLTSFTLDRFGNANSALALNGGYT